MTNGPDLGKIGNCTGFNHRMQNDKDNNEGW